LVDLGKVGKGWADIELEPEIKEATTQLIEQHVNGDSIAYGILQNSSIGGALIYGPPYVLCLFKMQPFCFIEQGMERLAP
jgi:hypothetical protein